MRARPASASAAPLLFSALAAFFAVWSLAAPASWLIGLLPSYRGPAATPVWVAADPDSLLRFAEWPSIRLLHCLAGGVWCACLVLQLATARAPGATTLSNPAASGHGKRAARRAAVHRASGSVMLAAAAAVTAGYVLMELGHRQVMANHGAAVCWTFYRPLAAQFALSAAGAALTVPSARGGGGATKQRARAARHAAFALRHAAAGLTFALARALVLGVGWALHASGALDMAAPDNKSRVFYWCSYSAAAVMVTSAEAVIAAARWRLGPGVKATS